MKDTQILQFLAKSSFLFCFLLFVQNNSIAQDWSELNVPFTKGGENLYNARINGMIAPQFSNIDFNGDGAMDVFVFDRQSGVVMPFVWDGTKLVFTSEYAIPFPPMLYFAQLRDYDRDGDQDLFTYSSTQPASSISVYKNVGSDSAPDFQFVQFPEAKANTLNYESDGKDEPIYVASTDVPSIDDVDGDGDLDVLSFESGSGSFLHLYRNMQVERALPQDTLVFVFEEFCWGRFIESGFDSSVKLSPSKDDCASALSNPKGNGHLRHGGSTTTLLDGDGDGDMDIIIGDLSSTQLIYLTNGGTNENAWMTAQDVSFPSNDEPVLINQFLSSSYVDVDNDGIRELIAAPNETNSSQNIDHIWLYENQGANDNPIFKLKTKSFLVEYSLQIPEFSRPAFSDINGDGLQDLIVGCYGYNTPTSYAETRLFYFKNIGKKSQPEYSLESDDYLGFSALDNVNKLDPVFGDLDGDGDEDLIIGTSEGELIYVENNGDATIPATPVLSYMNIDVGRDARPEIVDLNDDELPDLLIGENNDNTDAQSGLNGGVNYFENIGTVDSPMFSSTPNTSALGGVFTKKSGYVTSGSSAPKVIPTEDEGDFLIFVGSNYGDIYLYDGVKGQLTREFSKVSDSLNIPRQGRRTGLSLADVDDDNYYEMCVGNENGGLTFFNTPYKVSSMVATIEKELDVLKIYPNPTSDIFVIEHADNFARFELVTLDGKLVKSGDVKPQIELNRLPNGMYLVKLISDKKEFIQKIIVNR